MHIDQLLDGSEYSLLEHQAAVGRNYRTVSFIKDEFCKQEPDPFAISEAWYELSPEDQQLLWRAPTKGGCFTTHERAWLKTNLKR